MLAADVRPRRGDRVLSQRAEDTVVLLDPRSGEYYALDEVGGRIWDLCDGTRTVGEIAGQISDEYAAPASVVHADVQALLQELALAELVARDV